MMYECPKIFIDKAIVENPKEILESMWSAREKEQDEK